MDSEMDNEKTPEENTEVPEHEEADVSKKEKDNLLYWSLFFLAAIVVLFFAANIFFSEEPTYETVTYNNWEFTKMADLWWFGWQKEGKIYQVPLRFNPYEAENVSINGKLNAEKFNARKYVYITFNLSNESSQNFAMLALASTELTQNIATAINRTPIAACTNDLNEACDERPVKTCSNTDEPVIYLNEGGRAALTLDEACVTITGKGFELVRAVDRLLYHWYRII